MATAKTTGAEFRKFYSEDTNVWNEGQAKPQWYVDDLVIVVNGQDQDMDAVYQVYGEDLEKLPDDAKIEIVSGYFGWQGDGADPGTRENTDLASFFKKWVKNQSTRTIVATLEIPVDMDPAELERIEGVLNDLGAKFVSARPTAPAKAAPKPR